MDKNIENASVSVFYVTSIPLHRFLCGFVACKSKHQSSTLLTSEYYLRWSDSFSVFENRSLIFCMKILRWEDNVILFIIEDDIRDIFECFIFHDRFYGIFLSAGRRLKPCRLAGGEYIQLSNPRSIWERKSRDIVKKNFISKLFYKFVKLLMDTLFIWKFNIYTIHIAYNYHCLYKK